ncbi:MAG: alpha/beta fold hydrolase [Gammaproteobacteria bacterium]|nr:alpha/beta fold hydrolase [Gammaproteobacteria bacterium]
MTWLIVLALLYVLFLVALYLAQDRMIFKARPGQSTTPGDLGLDYSQETLTTADGERINAWFIPRGDSRYCLLFFHGNRDSLSEVADSLRQFHDIGLNVFAIDYRGYGLSSGRPGEQGLYQDAEAAWRHLVAEKGFPPQQIIVHGRSLGAAVAAYIASCHHPAAVILESTFTSMSEIVGRHYPFVPVRWMLRSSFPTSSRMNGITSPVLIVHSKGDEFIPFSHGQALFDAAPEPRALLEIGGQHYDGYKEGDRYIRGIADFLSSVLPATPA